MSRLARLEHPSNARSPIAHKCSGRTINLRTLHDWNIPLSSLLMCGDSFTACSLRHLANACRPISVKDVGRTTWTNAEHSWKACLPKVLSLTGISISFSDLQPRNAELPIRVVIFGSLTISKDAQPAKHLSGMHSTKSGTVI